MRNKKRRVFLFSAPDYRALEQYLAKEAEKGWLLEKVGVLFAQFIRIEPRKVKFQVDIYSEHSVFDSPEDPRILEYRELCLENGWKFLTSAGKMQIFWAEEDEETSPLQSEISIEKSIVAKTIKPELVIFLICIPALYLALGELFNPGYHSLVYCSGIAALIAYPLVFLPILLYTGDYLLWFVRANLNVRKGRALPASKLNWVLFRGRLLYFMTSLAVLILFWGLLKDFMNGYYYPLYKMLFPVTGITVGLLFRTKGVSAKRTRGQNQSVFAFLLIGMLIFLNVTTNIFANSASGGFDRLLGAKNELPAGYQAMQLQDIGVHEEPEQIRFYPQKSILVPRSFEYYERSEKGYFRTRFWQARDEALNERIFEQLLNAEERRPYREVKETLPTPYGAERAYILNEREDAILLRYREKIVLLEGGEPLIGLAEQIKSKFTL